MHMKKAGVAAVCAAIAAVVVYVTLFRASDEDRIREDLADSRRPWR
jgi:hypothetical protein